jgi:UDP-2-acetamido-3-amino-2,3-dideoxy-glucuronate N-acetyltransferase
MMSECNSKENNVFIHPTAEVSPTAKIGFGTRIWHHGQIMPEASVGNNCNFGKGVFIDYGVSIGSNVKIQNYVSVYRGVVIEDDCFLGPSMVFTNDMFPRSTSDNFKVVRTYVSKGASIGANATIVCGSNLGRYSMVGAGSVVTNNVAPHTLVVGCPARPIGYVCKCGSRFRIDYPAGYPTTLNCVECGYSFRTD